MNWLPCFWILAFTKVSFFLSCTRENLSQALNFLSFSCRTSQRFLTWFLNWKSDEIADPFWFCWKHRTKSHKKSQMRNVPGHIFVCSDSYTLAFMDICKNNEKHSEMFSGRCVIGCQKRTKGRSANRGRRSTRWSRQCQISEKSVANPNLGQQMVQTDRGLIALKARRFDVSKTGYFFVKQEVQVNHPLSKRSKFEFTPFLNEMENKQILFISFLCNVFWMLFEFETYCYQKCFYLMILQFILQDSHNFSLCPLRSCLHGTWTNFWPAPLCWISRMMPEVRSVWTKLSLVCIEKGNDTAHVLFEENFALLIYFWHLTAILPFPSFIIAVDTIKLFRCLCQNFPRLVASVLFTEAKLFAFDMDVPAVLVSCLYIVLKAATNR